MSQIKVADISRWQGTIDWDEFRKHIDGVVIKATGADGGLYVDGQFKRNQAEARRVGLPIWYYHFKGSGSAEQQAEHMLATIGELKAGEAIVLDDENESRINVDFDTRFADYIKEKTKLNIVLYSNQSRFGAVDLKPLADRNIGAWVAKYGANTGTVDGAGAEPKIPTMKIIMWQYTSRARIPGVSVNTVDMNIFYGDEEQFRKYGAESNTPAPTPIEPPAQTGSGVYTVVKGDTLIKIGNKTGQDWQKIARDNGIVSPYVIYPGQKLRVFGGSTGSSRPSKPNTYQVIPGDTLSGIGIKVGVAWREIANSNGIKSPYTIYPGQVLKIPGAGSATVKTYTVQPGDSLSKIGARVGVKWQDLARINSVSPPYTIYPGQVIRVS